MIPEQTIASEDAPWELARKPRVRKREGFHPLLSPGRYPLVPVVAFCLFVLLGIGLVALLSVEGVRGNSMAVFKQALFAGAGAIGLLVLWSFSYQRLMKLSLLMYVAMVGLLLLVLVAGVEINGARRWLRIIPSFDVKIQPSEFVRPTLILLLAWYFSRFQDRIKSLLFGVFLPLGMTGVFCALILLERDYGMTAFVGCLCVGMMFVAGSRILPMLTVMMLAGAVFVSLVMMDPLRRGRVEAFFKEPEKGSAQAEIQKRINFQADQSVQAIKEGAILGRGLANGYRKEGFFVPESSNDFIFSVIGEELGLVGTLGVVVLYACLVLIGIFTALRAPDIGGVVIASGLSLNLGGQALLNLLVVTKLFVNKGLPLPFISQGGSNLMMHMACIGILLNIYVQGQAKRQRERKSQLPLIGREEDDDAPGTIDF